MILIVLLVKLNLPINPVIIVKLSKGRLITDLHIKDTDPHQYFNSSHPDHTKRSIIYSQTLRLTKICTFENYFLRMYTVSIYSYTNLFA